MFVGGGEFENGKKMEAGQVLTVTVGPTTGAANVTFTWTNTGLKLTHKKVAFAMEYAAASDAGGATGSASAK